MSPREPFEWGRVSACLYVGGNKNLDRSRELELMQGRPFLQNSDNHVFARKMKETVQNTRKVKKRILREVKTENNHVFLESHGQKKKNIVERKSKNQKIMKLESLFPKR